MFSNQIGSNNIAVGTGTLYSNISANENIAIGADALHFNTTGNSNCAIGSAALLVNETGYLNIAIGLEALENSTDYGNTAIGAFAGKNITTGHENTAIGTGANVPSATGHNQVRIGSSSVTYAGIQVPWTITSDRRWKSDIQASNLGLDFISKLKPVSYYRTNDESKKREYGFIAQELEEALNAAGAADNGIISKDDNGWYGVRYNDLMTPMVKAIQEQQTIIENQNRLINDLMNRIEILEDK
jgi:hypothetical protein